MERQAKDAAISEAALLWILVDELSDARSSNYQTIKRRTFWLNAAAALLVLQIVGWALLLI